MRHRRLRKPRSAGEINVTPLIDVVMCLVIFYLMVGKLAGDRRAQVDLPQTRVGSEAEQNVIVVNIVPADGPGWPGPGAQVLLERDPVRDADTLARLIRDRLGSHPGAVVQLRAEKDLPWEMVSPVLKTCAIAGDGNVRLAAERAPRAPRGEP